MQIKSPCLIRLNRYVRIGFDEVEQQLTLINLGDLDKLKLIHIRFKGKAHQ